MSGEAPAGLEDAVVQGLDPRLPQKHHRQSGVPGLHCEFLLNLLKAPRHVESGMISPVKDAA
jgi:hypothetical protein